MHYFGNNSCKIVVCTSKLALVGTGTLCLSTFFTNCTKIIMLQAKRKNFTSNVKLWAVGGAANSEWASSAAIP